MSDLGDQKKSIVQQLKEIPAMVLAIEKRSHAGFALVAGQILDTTLEEVLVNHMPGLNKDMRKRLFSGFGPLATFSSRIHIAEALGLIDKTFAKELHKMRVIRNMFAHSMRTLHFEDEKVLELLAKLSEPSNGRLPQKHFVEAVAEAVKALTPLMKTEE
ncbi:Abi family protein [Mesorhizobium sp. AR10]|uniref:Abi family protein n=1 Tax=Mesorhizobium sp. AR10 TaxID=2865839 RepID=UPI00215FFB65|nr:Abi family protein [Mesorhizobium sp. AR10]UVK36839.1 Abi family protein [Mesorhizobium sp. AR10]